MRDPASPPEPLRDALDIAHAMADVARAVAGARFRAPDLAAENKSARGYDPVTEADRAAEAAMREILARRLPDDGVFGEEFGRRDGVSGRVWVLDPIDGTRAFLAGLPVWGVLIALSVPPEPGGAPAPVLGVVDQPCLAERYVGWRDPQTGRRAAWVFDRAGARPLATRPCAALADAILLSTSPRLFEAGAERAAYERVAAAVRLERLGSDCYGYAMIAAGQADLVIEAGLAPYDVQAPIALIEAAGGVVTDWSGGPAHAGGRVCAAGDPVLHAQALAMLNG